MTAPFSSRREALNRKRLVDLSRADVVLTTYQALRKEVHYAADYGVSGAQGSSFPSMYKD